MSRSPDPLMAQALALTRAGKLGEATAKLVAALQGAAPAPAMASADIIDVVARVLHDDDIPSRPSRPQPSHAGRPTQAPAAASFNSGVHAEPAGSRGFKLFLPAGASHAGQPLVVMLHGCQQDAADFARGTGMNEAAGRLGFPVLYPEQAADQNPSGCWNWFKHSHQSAARGEPAILAGMVRQIVQQHGLDHRRVYVAGLSAGGAMAAILGQACPSLFAAVGVHSGLPSGAADDLGSALAAMQGRGPLAAPAAKLLMPPTIVFHGDQDGTVHPVNGERVAAAAAGKIRGSTQSLPDEAGRRCTRTRYHDTAGKLQAEHWLVHGAGHAWSGGLPAGSFTDSRGPNASEAMLSFFLQHRLPD